MKYTIRLQKTLTHFYCDSSEELYTGFDFARLAISYSTGNLALSIGMIRTL